MRNRWRPIFGLVGFLMLAGSLAAQQAKEYSFPEHGFAVRSRSSVHVESIGKESWTLTREPYVAFYISLLAPQDNRSENQILDERIHEITAIRGIQDVVESIPDHWTSSHPARIVDSVLKVAWNREHFRQFLSVANGRLYGITLQGKGGADHPFPAEAIEFMNSFQIIEKEKPKAAAESDSHAQAMPAVKSSIRLHAQPSHAQAYLDGKFQGMAGDDGDLLIDTEPGLHHLRVSLPEYKDWKQDVTVSQSKVAPVDAVLEPVGPKPLGKDDILELLRGGVAKSRIVGMINDYGIDFELTDAIEQDLRHHGADDSLLLAIAKASKKK